MVEIIDEITIVNKDLVDIWGTDKNKEKYKIEGKVTSSMKKTLLNRARTECIILDVGRGNYFIEKVREFKIPLEFLKVENTIYEYLCPLIINQSIKSYHNEENKLEISLIKYYNILQSINHNYNNIRYGSKDSCDKLSIDINNHRNFFSETSTYLKRILENALNHLEKMGAIKWYKFRMVAFRCSELEENSKQVNVGLKYEHRRATEKEIRYELDIKKEIMTKLEIEEEKECYFGKKSNQFKKLISERFKEKHIKFFYDGYEVYYTSIEKCERILSLFNITNSNKLSNIFNKCIINNIIQNAENRRDGYLIKEPSKYRKINIQTYLEDYTVLLENAININAENLIIKKDLEIDYKMENGILVVSIND